MKTYAFILVLLICSCSDHQYTLENQSSLDASGNEDTNLTFELIDDRNDQEKALYALNTIQIISGSHLYSTFAYCYHRCKGSSYSVNISKSELENALLDLLDQYYPNISSREKTYLALTASKAQNEYLVTICEPCIETLPDESKAPPRTGVWIFRAFLDETDLIIKW